MSRDEQNAIIVSYAELKHCYDKVFSELLTRPPIASPVAAAVTAAAAAAQQPQ